jgi:uncharacterized protein
MRRGSDDRYGAWRPINVVRRPAIEIILNEGIVRLEGVAQNVTCDSDQSRFFVGMVGMVVIGRVRTVDSKFRIVIMRMIAVIVGMPVIGDSKCRGMQAECVGARWHEGEDEHGDAGQHGRETSSESSSLSKQHAQGDNRHWLQKQENALNYPLQGDRRFVMTVHRHDSHPDIVKRLKRAEGHLKSVIAMIEAGRPCLDIAQQLHAVEKAVENAKRTLIQDHLDHCLDETVGALDLQQRKSIDEFKAITKYL